ADPDAADPAGPRQVALAAERRAAARVLMAHPLVNAAGPYAEALTVIHRHAGWLTDRFGELLGYRLIVTPTCARLLKAGLGPGTLRRVELDGVPLTPAAYAALTLTLAELEAGPSHWPADRLSARVTRGAVEAGLAAPASGRSPLDAPAGDPLPELPEASGAPGAPAAVGVGPAEVAVAVALLTRWQVLTVQDADGAADPGTDGGPDGGPDGGEGARLRVDRDLVAALLLGPSAWSGDAASDGGTVGSSAMSGAPGSPARPTAEVRTSVPVAVRRRLAETPVVLLAELTALEREWLWESRHREVEAFAEFLGLSAEIRREGIALLDPAGELTDVRLPGSDVPAHAALLLVERLVDQLRPLPLTGPGVGVAARESGDGGSTGVGVPIAEALIDGILGDVADEYGDTAGWRRDHLADRAAFRREVLDLLHRMRLIAPTREEVAPAGPAPGEAGTAGRRLTGGWSLLAPAARLAAELELRPATRTGRHSRREHR
ncbi:DUF2398 family protein, partial [Kitasatospora nipponensis]|uniref:DUF2398 family protein n=1 Tax=Kitasatospora nipponensis TaxID=258049 RepID=UPI0031D12D94